MSGADVTMLLNTQYGNLSALFAGPQTLWQNRGYDRTNIFAIDNTYFATTVGNEANFGQQCRFKFRKRGAKVHRSWLRVVMTQGQIDNANFRAAFHDDLAAALLENCRLSYASKVLQEYNGDALKAYKRLMEHDINREHYYAMAWGNLPPGGAGFEAIREGNVAVVAPAVPVVDGFVVYIPLDWLYFTRCEDYALVPEALSTELDLEVNYRPLARVVYARTAAGAVAAVNPFTIQPTINRTEFFQQLIHVPVPEKNASLMTYDSDQGNLFKILDFEPQVNTVIATGAGTYNIGLDNLRLDSQFLMFFMRDVNADVDWAQDRMLTDPTPTILPGGGAVNSLQQINSFRFIANGRVIVDTVTDIENRAIHRDMYLKGTQVAEPVYFIPFSWLIQDSKNVSSFQNLANLGNLVLEITVGANPYAGNTRFVDVYSVSHNIVQWKRGDVVKALR